MGALAKTFSGDFLTVEFGRTTAEKSLGAGEKDSKVDRGWRASNRESQEEIHQWLVKERRLRARGRCSTFVVGSHCNLSEQNE